MHFNSDLINNAKEHTLKDDMIFKIFFGKKENQKFLISFLESILKIKIYKLEVFQEASLELLHSTDKSGRLDIKATVDNSKIINIEVQLEKEKDFRKRTTYYGSRLISSQLIPGEEYDKLKPVVLINILNFNLLDVPEYYTEAVTVAKNHPDYEIITDVKYYFIELPKFRKAKPRICNILDCWLALIDGNNKEMINMAEQMDPIIKEAVEKLEELMQDQKVREIYEYRLSAELEDTARKNRATRKGLEQGMKQGMKKGIKEGRKQGLQEGLKEGRKEGRREGLKEGRRETSIEIAKNLLKQGLSISRNTGSYWSIRRCYPTTTKRTKKII